MSKGGENMCPKLKGAICSMVELSPNNLVCVDASDCFGGDWQHCSVYVSQFFFDKNDEFVE